MYSYDSIQLFLSIYLSKFIIIPHSLLLLIIYSPVFFPSPLLGIWWKTLPTIFRWILFFSPRPRMKYSRTLYPIFPVVLITPTCMVLMTGPKLVSHYPPSAWRLIKSVYDGIFSSCVQQVKGFSSHFLRLPLLLVFHYMPRLSSGHSGTWPGSLSFYRWHTTWHYTVTWLSGIGIGWGASQIGFRSRASLV